MEITHQRKVTFLAILIRLSNEVCDSISSSLYQKYSSERVQGNLVYRIATRSELACCILCLNVNDKTCTAVNFNHGDKTCELFYETANTITGQVGWTRISFTDSTCGSDWVKFENKCFKVFYSGRTWDSALIECQSLDGSLASLQTKEMFDFLSYQLRDVSDRFWIGARDYAENNSFYHWMDGTQVSGYNPWYPGEPNGAAEACVELKYRDGAYSFNDHQCTKVYKYICEKMLS